MAATKPPADAFVNAAYQVIGRLLGDGRRLGTPGDRDPIAGAIGQLARECAATAAAEERAACLAILRDELAQLPELEVYAPVKGAMVRLCDRILARKVG